MVLGINRKKSSSTSICSPCPKPPSTRALPPDASDLRCGPDPCHCVSEKELELRYNVLRAEEHARLEGKCGEEWSRVVAQRQDNQERNRYGNIIPWDHSRVLLPVQEGGNDYINASWIQLGTRAYIAAQGPLPGTIGHFWHMIYAYGGDPAVIIMLTPLHEQGVEKCAKYWPESRDDVISVSDEGFGFGLNITFEKCTKNAHYNYSLLHLTPTDDRPRRVVHHIYYHSWMDYTKPNTDADLRALIHIVNNTLKNPASPMVVHCSAGIGRTGTFIAIDALLVRVDKEISDSIAPDYCPVWAGPQSVYVDKRNPFNGTREELSEEEILIALKEKALQDGVNEDALSSLPGSASTGHLEQLRKLKTWESEGSQTLQEEADENVDAPPPVIAPSAKTGPVCMPQKRTTSRSSKVSEECLRLRPENIDVFHCYNKDDPVLSVVSYMRMQRPKMVQGAQQLGYIYDQLEVATQLVRSHYRTSRVERRATVEMGSVFQRSDSVSSTTSQSSTESTSSQRRKGLHRSNFSFMFHGTSARQKSQKVKS